LRGLLRLTIVLVAIGVLPAAVRQQNAEIPSTTMPAPAAMAAPELPELSAPYLESAAAFRRGDYKACRKSLAPLTVGHDQAVQVARLVLGFHAQQLEELSEARELLDLAATPENQLEDWRLFVLAEAAAAHGDAAAAEEYLTHLVSDFPSSPIRAVAIQRAAEIAAENQLWQPALGWIDRGRSEPMPTERSSELERIAWETGQHLERPDLQELAAKRLLIDHPQKADELAVAEYFADSAGEIDWTALLTSDESLQRARSLIDTGKVEAALASLEAIAAADRSFRWWLLHSEALTRDHRGTDALQELQNLNTNEPSWRVELYWQRALAARDAARVRRGRANLPQSQRQEMRTLATENLEVVSRLTPDPELSRRALRLLFAELSDDDYGSFDQALTVLQRLQQLESTDTTGTRYLWRLGWQAFTKRDYTVAIGYWSELGSIYPTSNTARGGRYWTARSHETLGHDARSREIYRGLIAADTTDFYSRHARTRLGESNDQATTELSYPTEPWPEDPILERARWLSDLGLDELALLELEGLREAADRRSHCAVKAIVLARNGRRRESIQSLVCAFPSLGRPYLTLVPEDALRLYYPLDFREIIEQRAKEQSLSPFLVFAMVRQESGFDAEARSWAGARGLMQLMPATARELAQRMGLRYSSTRLGDPDYSIRLGTRYFRQVLEMFDGNQELALAGYNGGPYRIKKLWRQAGQDPELDRFLEGLSLEETKTYVKRILLFEDSYEKLYADNG